MNSELIFIIIIIIIIIVIIRQPLCPVVGRMPQKAFSTLACLVLSSARSCRSSCQGRLSTAWLVTNVVYSCRYGLQLVTHEVYRSFLRRLICLAKEHFIVSHCVHYIYDFCPLSDPYVGLSVRVCDVEHTSFHFDVCAAASLFALIYCESISAAILYCEVSTNRILGDFYYVVSNDILDIF